MNNTMPAYGPSSVQAFGVQGFTVCYKSFPEVCPTRPSRTTDSNSSGPPLPQPPRGGQVRSRLTASLQAGTNRQPLPQGAPAQELHAILQNNTCSVDGSPATTFLGVSPPVREGAANPFATTRCWQGAARLASHTNLAALQELLGENMLPLGSPPAFSLSGSEGGSWCSRSEYMHPGGGTRSCRTQHAADSWRQHKRMDETA